MKRKRWIIPVVAVVIGVAVYFLLLQNEYSGTFDLNVNGIEYNLKLNTLERFNVGDGVIYDVVFSEKENNIRVTFKVWEEDGEAYISIDDPRMYLDGTQYHLLHPLKRDQYYVDALLDNYIWITFWNPPMNNQYFLNGRFIIEGSNLLK